MFQQKNGKRFEEERDMTKTISLQPATFNTMEEEPEGTFGSFIPPFFKVWFR